MNGNEWTNNRANDWERENEGKKQNKTKSIELKLMLYSLVNCEEGF